MGGPRLYLLFYHDDDMTETREERKVCVKQENEEEERKRKCGFAEGETPRRERESEKGRAGAPLETKPNTRDRQSIE